MIGIFVLLFVVSFTNAQDDPPPNGRPKGAVNIHMPHCYLGFRFEVEYLEKAAVERVQERSTFRSSELFKSRFSSVTSSLATSQQSARSGSSSSSSSSSSSQSSENSFQASVSGEGFGFSAEASTEMFSMSASTRSDENIQSSSHANSQGTDNSQSQGISSRDEDRYASTNSESTVQRTAYNEGFLQVYRLETTILSVDGHTATKTDLKYIDSVATDNEYNSTELRTKAEDYIEYKFNTDNPKGRIWRNTYSECGCKSCEECNICELKDDEDEIEKMNKKIIAATNIALAATLPNGTIIPWVNRPAQTRQIHLSQIPDGWQRCDGSVIPSPSQWEGQRTPNINGEKRFLRGGSDRNQLITEEDSLQEHTHGVSDPGHRHRYHDKWTNFNGNGHLGPGSVDDEHDDWDRDHARETNLAQSNIRVTNVSGARTSGETRPKNIRVVYIMKVF